jgi:hypothetical protein
MPTSSSSGFRLACNPPGAGAGSCTTSAFKDYSG